MYHQPLAHSITWRVKSTPTTGSYLREGHQSCGREGEKGVSGLANSDAKKEAGASRMILPFLLGNPSGQLAGGGSGFFVCVVSCVVYVCPHSHFEENFEKRILSM